jgi:hypothetical protein
MTQGRSSSAGRRLRDDRQGPRRTIKAALAPAWIEFDGAAQVAQLRRTVTKSGRKMASLRSLAISLLRLHGHANIAAANRHDARDPQRPLRLLQTA